MTEKMVQKRAKNVVRTLAMPQPSKTTVLVEMPKDIQAAVSAILKRRGLVDQK